MHVRIRILHCLSVVAVGGVERRRLQLIKSLDPDRFEQQVLARVTTGPLVDEFRQAGCEIAAVGAGPLFAPRALMNAVRVTRRFRPHIVHGAVFEGLPLAVVGGRAVGAKVVIEETSYATNRSPRGHALFRALAAASDACIAISPAVGAYLHQVTRVPARKITLIVNGAPERRRSTVEQAVIRATLGLPADAFVVGTVARLVDDSHKRVSDLLRAAASLDLRDPALHWLVVGDGGERGMLELLTRSLGIRDRVVFTGHREDVADLMTAMDVFVLPSVREGFGLVIPEAMLCERPVIGVAAGGITDIVEHERTGLLVPPGSPGAIAAAVQRLRVEPALRVRLARAGRDHAQAHFSAERYVADVSQFYTALVRGDTGRAATSLA